MRTCDVCGLPASLWFKRVEIDCEGETRSLYSGPMDACPVCINALSEVVKAFLVRDGGYAGVRKLLDEKGIKSYQPDPPTQRKP